MNDKLLIFGLSDGRPILDGKLYWFWDEVEQCGHWGDLDGSRRERSKFTLENQRELGWVEIFDLGF